MGSRSLIERLMLPSEYEKKARYPGGSLVSGRVTGLHSYNITFWAGCQYAFRLPKLENINCDIVLTFCATFDTI